MANLPETSTYWHGHRDGTLGRAPFAYEAPINQASYDRGYAAGKRQEPEPRAVGFRRLQAWVAQQQRGYPR